MTDYGKGGVLGLATTLPATSALGLAVVERVHPMVIISIAVITLLSLLITLSYIVRYLANRA